MTTSITPAHRTLAVGAAAGALLIGAFALGAAQSNAAPTQATGAAGIAASAGTAGDAATAAGAASARGDSGTALLTAAPGSGRITVTGTGTVSGTPNQLILSMGVQINAGSVDAALQQASNATGRVTAALRRDGVGAAEIQTSNLYIQPNYSGNSQTPDGYSVSEALTATLPISAAGAEITAAVHAGGNATTVDGISLNLTDTSGLLAAARTAAVNDAKVKATQYAHALGQPLGAVLSVTDQSQQSPEPFAGQPVASSAKAVPISPGTQQLSVSVTVIFAVG